MTRRYADLDNGSFASLGYGHLPFRQAVRHGDVVYVTGQVAVEKTPSPMPQQARIAMANMKAVLAQVGATMADVVQTTSYYVGLDGLAASALIQSKELPLTWPRRLSSSPLSWSRDSWLRSRRLPSWVRARTSFASRAADPLGAVAPTCQAVRCGNTIYVSGLVATDEHGAVLHPGDMPRQAGATMERMQHVLSQLGATLDDVVHTTVCFVGAKGWKEAAQVRGRFFKLGPDVDRGRGPHAGESRVPDPDRRHRGRGHAQEIRRRADAERRRQAAAERAVSPGREVRQHDLHERPGGTGRNGEALHPTDIAGQTRVAMENIKALLAQFGATTEDVVRKNTYYVGVSDFRKTVPIRAEYFKTGICATGVGVDGLVVPGLLIEMEVTAIV